jgi:hypothetical protein
MRFCPSGGYDANDRAPHRAGDEKHSAVDLANSIAAQLVGDIEIIELDHIRVQEHLRGRSEVDTMLLLVG